PRLAGRLLGELGYTQGTDGMLRDGSGGSLSVELRTTTRVNEISVISDYWKRVGVDTAQNIIPRQLAQDLDYRTHFPGFDLVRSPPPPDVAVTPQLRTPENRYGGANYPNYSNPQYDAIVDRYFATIPRPDRLLIANQIIHWWSDQLIDLPLYYDIEAM